MALPVSVRWLLFLACVASVALGSHFRGGIIMVRPHPGGTEREMEISFHISWRRGEAFCDQSTIDSGIIVDGEGDVTCQYGCFDNSLGSLDFRCTDFSLSEDWSFGENRFTYTFTDESTIVTVGFTGCCWISPFSSSWNISTTFSLAVRNDTGRINSSPRAITTPVIRLQEGCNHTIRIPTSDPDADTVRCRWAVGQECGGICSRFPGAVLDPDTCSITYTANQGIGFRAAALMIEDFVPGSAIPMSSVALQFLVLVFHSSSSCTAIPEFIPPTLADGTCVAVPPGGTFTTRLIADSGSTGASITEIQTVSPAGVEKSEVHRVGQTTAYFVNITWSPLVNQQMQTFSFCYIAVNSVGLSSGQACIDLAAGNTPPRPVVTTPNGQAVHPFTTTWHISFDQNVTLPRTTAYITFHEMDTDMEVYRIDVSLSPEVFFDFDDMSVMFTPGYSFEEKKEFYIIFERGIVVGIEGCRPGNERVTDSTFWVFETLDVTPPIILFQVAPRVSNSNISLSWQSNEVVAWQCELITETQQLEVNCSTAVWSATDLSHGMYQLLIVATDTAGNMAQATHRFSIDTMPPIVSITRMPGEFSNQQTFQVQFSCNEICTTDCQFFRDDDRQENTYFPCNSRRYTTPSLVHDQTYTFSVKATDQVGNAGQPVSVTWHTDFEDPTVFGVTNTSAVCTGNISPTTTGQAQAIDNTSAVVAVRYTDNNTGCFIQRTWEAVDSAGNTASVTQYITLEFSLALDFLPLVSVACDSSASSFQVPSITATLQNSCRRPLQLSYEDSVSEYTCPVFFSRIWEAVDQCDQSTALYSQNISLYDLCPLNACGRNETMPHGVCIVGSCACNIPWFGDDCNTPIYPPQVEPVRDVVLEEGAEYTENLILVQGTPLLTWTLISAPNRLVLSGTTGRISWRRSQVGNHTITVQVINQAGRATVTWTVYVKPGYDAFLDPITEDVFAMAEPLQLTGHVEYSGGNIVKDLLDCVVPVSVDVTSRNTVRKINTFTNRDGSFSVVFSPALTEYGSYVAGAKHPSALNATEQTGWDFLGMRASPRNVRLSDSTVAGFKRTFHNATLLINDGPRPLNGLTASPSLGSIQGLTVVVSLNGRSSLQPGETVYVDIDIETVGAFDAEFPVRVEAREGVTLYFAVSLRISQIKPQLVVNPPSVNTRVVRGVFRNLEFIVTNVGIISATRVRAVLPASEFISLISFGNAQQQTEIEDFTLGSGNSAILSILVQIPSEQPLGDVSGEIIISSAEVFQRLRFNFLVSSNMLMNLTVVVEDEYTYFAEGEPLVSDALVRLVNNQRGIQETLNTAENNGSVTFFNIIEDRYELFLDAPGHIAVNQILVTSTEDPVVTIFLARRSVTYTWTVVPTTFEETYTITIEADFETHVPIPVVTITPSELSLEPYELGIEDIIQYNITNHGLIRADNVSFELPSGHPFLEFSTEVEDIGSLDALTSIIVPVRVTRSDAREKRNLGSCIAALFYAIGVAYQYICGDLQTRSASAVLRGFSHFSDCGSGTGGGRTIHVIPARGGGPGGGNVIRPRLDVQPYNTPTIISCDACLQSAVSCFLPQPLGIAISCLPVIFGNEPSIFANVLNIIGCGLSFLPGPFSCIFGLLKDCAIPAITRRSAGETVRDLIEAAYPTYNNLLLGVEILGDESWLEIEDPDWLSQVLRPTLSDVSDLGTLISETELSEILSFPPPNGATLEMVQRMAQRVNNTQYGWANGILEPTDTMNMASFSLVQNYTSEIIEFNERAKQKGFDSYIDAFAYARDQYNMIEDFDEEGGVCAVVRIRIEQELALTREAFLAKLEIENMESAPLEEILVEILITDFNTGTVTTHLFSISNATLSGSLTRSTAGWNLPSSGSGAAEWLIVPLSEAAPVEDQLYNVGGMLSYMVNGQSISIPLLPARITVMPDPSLLVHYFWEKYVVGDNPFTDELEPSVPFTLAVAIRNAGYGVAMNLRITSGQPEIIDNDKGLAVTFKIIGANIGSEAFDPSLTVDFGNILANTTKVARWWMVSSLQGEFMNYSATFEYMNPLGDPRLSVLDELVIHDLIRNVYIYQIEEDDGILDFLVNDRNDLFDFPDALYSSKSFERFNVTVGEVKSLQTIQPGTQRVVANSNNTGWVYFRYEDTQSVFSRTARTINATKHQNNQTVALPSENTWITREVQTGFREAGSLYLHIFDYIEEAGEVLFTLNLCTVNCPTDEQPFEISLPPVPPIDLQTVGVGSTWIEFTWEQLSTSHNVSNYVITVNGAGSREVNVTVESSASRANVTELEPTTEYTLTVIALTVDGQMSHPSIPLTILTAPSAPEGVAIDGVGVFLISLSWLPSTNVTTYIIVVSGGASDFNVTVEGSVNNRNVTGLLYSTEYSLRVIAVGRDGQQSLPSVYITATTLETVLTAPEGLVVDDIGFSWIAFSWQQLSTDVDIARSIIIIRGGGSAMNITVGGNGSSANVTGLQPGTEYTLQVVSEATDGQTSDPSSSLTATTLLPEVDVFFVNGTPRVQAGVVYAEMATNRPHSELRCRIKGLDMRSGNEDCSNGSYTRTGIPPGAYVLRVVAIDPFSRDRKILNFDFFVDSEEQHCSVHLTNRGWRVEGQSFIVEFSSTGVTTGFTCSLNREEFDCTSPLVLQDLTPGRYVVAVAPKGCTDFRRWKQVFRIE